MMYTRDHLGSIRELVDMQGNVRARYEYDPWGRATKISGDRDSVFTFTGHFWHPQSGLNLTLYRAYDPNLGRWISRDPIEETGDTNIYRYALGDPVQFTDPFGLDTDSWGRTCSQCEMTKINIWNDIPAGIPHTFFTMDYPNGNTYGMGFYPQAPYHNQAIIPGNPVPGEVRPNTFHPPVNDPGHSPGLTFMACPGSVNQFWHGVNLTMRDPKFNNYDLYNIFGGNCTSFVCSVLENSGIKPPFPSGTPLLNPWSLAGAYGGRY